MTALIFTVALVLLIAFVAVFVFLTEGDDGAVHKPHWPARYPHVQRKHRAPKTARGIYGDVTRYMRAGVKR